MIELERHIEILLLSNDCVIVPDLGGFMAHHIEARYDEEDKMFLPPQRTLGFNPQLKLNDSLLAQSYVEAYDISYPEAVRRIEAEVVELKQHLENEGCYELNDIGLLKVNDEGKLEFTPCEAGILTPELYGLSSFEMKPIKIEHIEQLPLPPEEKTNLLVHTPTESLDSAKNTTGSSIPSVLSIGEIDEEEEVKTISIRVAWLRNAVAIAAAVLAFFLITTPVSNSIDNTATMGIVSLAAIADTQSSQPKV